MTPYYDDGRSVIYLQRLTAISAPTLRERRSRLVGNCR